MVHHSVSKRWILTQRLREHGNILSTVCQLRKRNKLQNSVTLKYLWMSYRSGAMYISTTRKISQEIGYRRILQMETKTILLLEVKRLFLGLGQKWIFMNREYG